MLTNREHLLLEEIRSWERKLHLQERKSGKSYHQWVDQAFNKLPQSFQQLFYDQLDHVLFHLHSLIQGSTFQKEAKDRILHSVQTKYPSIQEIKDMRTLPIEMLLFITDQEITKHCLYSFTQGGLTGAGGLFFIIADIPVLFGIHLRLVQLLSLIYGYEVNSPYEMMISYRLFHLSTLPKQLKWREWRNLIDIDKINRNEYLWEVDERANELISIHYPLKQLVKCLFILLVKRKLFQGIPLLSIGIGAGVNCTLTKQVAEVTKHFYQLRYLREKGENK